MDSSIKRIRLNHNTVLHFNIYISAKIILEHYLLLGYRTLRPLLHAFHNAKHQCSNSKTLSCDTVSHHDLWSSPVTFAEGIQTIDKCSSCKTTPNGYKWIFLKFPVKFISRSFLFFKCCRVYVRFQGNPIQFCEFPLSLFWKLLLWVFCHIFGYLGILYRDNSQLV